MYTFLSAQCSPMLRPLNCHSPEILIIHDFNLAGGCKNHKKNVPQVFPCHMNRVVGSGHTSLNSWCNNRKKSNRIKVKKNK